MNINFGNQPTTTHGMKPFGLLTRSELQNLSWEQGMTDAEIATMYGISSNQVYEKRKQMNLIHGQITSEQLTEIVRLAESIKTLPLEAISEIREIVNRYVH